MNPRQRSTSVLLALASIALALFPACDERRTTAPDARDQSMAPAGSGATGDGPSTAVAAGLTVTAGGAVRVDMPALFTLKASFSDAAAAVGPWRYTIDWGDASTVASGSSLARAATISATHAYAAEKVYTVTVTVRNGAGAAASASAPITVVDHVRIVTISPAKVSTGVASTTQLTAKAIGTTGRTLAGRVFTWKSGRTTVATVSSSGLVTGVFAGTATVSATAELKVGTARFLVRGLPFGPFHLPIVAFKPPYSGLLRTATPATLLATLSAARKAHFQVLLRMVNGSKDYSNPDSTFSLAIWKATIDRYRGINISSYLADGTIIGHFLIDEPRDPANWGGVPVSYADIDAAAAYSKSIWPTMPTGAGGPASDMAAGAPYASLDFAFSQYREKKGDLATWLAGQTAAARGAGLGLVLSINLLDGNLDNSTYAAPRFEEIGVALAAEPYACALTTWKYDSLVFADPAFATASAHILNVASGRAPHRCARD